MTNITKLLERHSDLIHSQMKKVLSHVQRVEGDWFINTITIEDCEAPFRYKRRRRYQNLKGARVDLTYYVSHESVAGIEMEIMNVVRIRRS